MVYFVRHAYMTFHTQYTEMIKMSDINNVEHQ